jgi:hypothetical protein
MARQQVSVTQCYRLRLSQAQLAERLGAASKAVVYQWEAQKRRPSPILWQRIEKVEHECAQRCGDECPTRSSGTQT